MASTRAKRGIAPETGDGGGAESPAKKTKKDKDKVRYPRLSRKLWLTHCRRQIWWQRRMQVEMLPPKTKVAIGRIGRNCVMKPARKPKN